MTKDELKAALAAIAGDEEVMLKLLDGRLVDIASLEVQSDEAPIYAALVEATDDATKAGAEKRAQVKRLIAEEQTQREAEAAADVAEAEAAAARRREAEAADRAEADRQREAERKVAEETVAENRRLLLIEAESRKKFIREEIAAALAAERAKG